MTALRRVLAVLIAVRGLTNFGKPYDMGSGFVIAGKLMHGVAATVVAPLFGAGMLVYAWGLWRAKPWAFSVAVVYAIWATVNVLLFPVFEPLPPGLGRARGLAACVELRTRGLYSFLQVHWMVCSP